MKNDLFNQTLLDEYSNQFKPTYKQKETIREYIEKVEKGEFKAETKNYINFYDIILKEILGYERDNVSFDEKVDDGAGRSEFVLKKGDTKFMVVELKGQGVDLEKVDVKSRKNYTLLKNEFEESIGTINPLLDEISETDEKIDSMVYNLYGLTDEEIKIIEDNLN